MRSNEQCQKGLHIMKMILRILKDDLKGVGTNFFALVVMIGLCVIPCLYAWFNIYSNWDPYGNTGNVKIAVMSEDVGYTDEDGEYYNMGNSVIDSLKENDKLGWVFVSSREAAEDGVRSGKYYAAIVIGSTFSENMFDFIEDGLATPSITYYENAKKNAIASKITQSGKSTLEETINEEFVNTVVTTIVSGADGMFGDDDDVLTTILDDLNTLNEDLVGYDEAVASFISSNEAVISTLNQASNMMYNAGQEFSPENIESMKAAANEDVNAAVARINNILTYIRGDNEQIINSLTEIQNTIKNAPSTDISGELASTADSLDDLIAQNQALTDTLTEMAGKLNDTTGTADMANAIYAIAASLNSMNTTLQVTAKALVSQLSSMSAASATAATVINTAISGLAGQTVTTLQRLNEVYDSQIDPIMAQLADLMTASVDSMYDSMGAATSNVSYYSQVLDGLSDCVSGMNEALEQVSSITSNLSEKLTEITDSLNDVSGDERYETLKKLLGNDASLYGEFFSSPVEVTTVNVYETANYGSSVTPFYTTLAIWVGGILLAAIVKTAPDKREYLKDAKEHELYFSRLFLYIIFGLVQAVITALGDIYILKVQCLHPGLFMLISCFTSITFITLIYTLTLSFGDVGKALVVVLVVIQIAGSSGTYPIEILPTFFANIYKYLPFPYAIDAMRECISGMYANDYWLNYIGLAFYLAGSLLLGLFARKPFVKMNHFVHERMHDTEMM